MAAKINNLTWRYWQSHCVIYICTCRCRYGIKNVDYIYIVDLHVHVDVGTELRMLIIYIL
jgi:hypothetical protein